MKPKPQEVRTIEEYKEAENSRESIEQERDDYNDGLTRDHARASRNDLRRAEGGQ